jgi:hypothetical protein
MIITYLAVTLIAIACTIYIVKRGERKRHNKNRKMLYTVIERQMESIKLYNSNAKEYLRIIEELNDKNLSLQNQLDKKQELPQLGGKYDIKPITSR